MFSFVRWTSQHNCFAWDPSGHPRPQPVCIWARGVYIRLAALCFVSNSQWTWQPLSCSPNHDVASPLWAAATFLPLYACMGSYLSAAQPAVRQLEWRTGTQWCCVWVWVVCWLLCLWEFDWSDSAIKRAEKKPLSERSINHLLGKSRKTYFCKNKCPSLVKIMQRSQGHGVGGGVHRVGGGCPKCAGNHKCTIN